MSWSATSTHFLITSRDGDSTTSLGSLFQCLTTLSVKKVFLISNPNLPWCNLRPCSGLWPRRSCLSGPLLSLSAAASPAPCWCHQCKLAHRGCQPSAASSGSRSPPAHWLGSGHLLALPLLVLARSDVHAEPLSRLGGRKRCLLQVQQHLCSLCHSDREERWAAELCMGCHSSADPACLRLLG